MLIIYIASPVMALVEAYYNNFQEKLDILLAVDKVGNQLEDFVIIKRHMSGSIICDSGAFGVYKKTSNLTLSKVISFFKSWYFKFDLYFNFDNDFSADSFDNNYESYQKMLKAGLNPVPVIHNFYNGEIAFYMKHHKCEWLALGSAQTKRFKDVEFAVKTIKKLSPDTKIHLFGRCDYEWLCKLPIDSCDIATPQIVAGLGYMLYWNEDKKGVDKTEKIYIGGRMKNLKPSEQHYKTHPKRDALDAYLKDEFKFEYRNLVGYNGAEKIQLINVRYYTELQKRINEHRTRNKVV